MSPIPWITDIPMPPGSPTRIVRREEIMRIFRAFARAQINVTDGDVSETPDGIAIRPRLETSTSARGLTVTPTNESGGGFYIEPSYVGGMMPVINGVALNHDPAPVLSGRTGDLIGVWFNVSARLNIEGGFRPVGYGETPEIGWSSLHTASAPKITWADDITDNPPAMDGVDHTIKDGRWFLPIARVTNSQVIQLLSFEPGSFMNVPLDFATRHW